MSRRWVMVTDDPSKLIHPDGPSLWNDEPEWVCPHAGYQWMEERPALDAGYAYPVQDEPPADPEG